MGRIFINIHAYFSQGSFIYKPKAKETMKYLIASLLIMSLLTAQTYQVGETMSLTHQNMAFDVCYGDYPSDQFRFADLNGDLNGGTYYITFVDMAATW